MNKVTTVGNKCVSLSFVKREPPLLTTPRSLSPDILLPHNDTEPALQIILGSKLYYLCFNMGRPLALSELKDNTDTDQIYYKLRGGIDITDLLFYRHYLDNVDAAKQQLPKSTIYRHTINNGRLTIADVPFYEREPYQARYSRLEIFSPDIKCGLNDFIMYLINKTQSMPSRLTSYPIRLYQPPGALGLEFERNYKNHFEVNPRIQDIFSTKYITTEN